LLSPDGEASTDDQGFYTLRFGVWADDCDARRVKVEAAADGFNSRSGGFGCTEDIQAINFQLERDSLALGPS
jgi:hypothetical protein